MDDINKSIEKLNENTINVTNELLNRVFKARKALTPEFDARTCTYTTPPEEASHEILSVFNVAGIPSNADEAYVDDVCADDGINPEDRVPDEWLKSLDDDCRNTILGLPRTRQEFRALKLIIKSIDNQIANGKYNLVDHVVFPVYSKELDIAWRDLLEVEAKRKRISECKQVWKDMWEHHPELMKETMPDYIPQDEELQGLVVIYINVGHLSVPQAEAYIDMIKKNLKSLKNIPLSYGVMWLPVRPPEQNKVDIIRF